MKSRKQPYYLIAVMPVFYAFTAYILAYAVKKSGGWLSGTDTLYHLYRGSALFDAIMEGDLWPMYDRLVCNGVEFMRYDAPVPAFVLAVCRFLGGDNPMGAFPLFVMFIFFAGAIVWLFVGFKLKRPFVGAFLGFLWFFMPANLYALFAEGDLPRALCIVILPLLMYLAYDYLKNRKWGTLPKLALCFGLTALCHFDYAGMILIAFFIYFVADAIIYGSVKRCGEAFIEMVLGFGLSGAWLVPSLNGGTAAADSSSRMEDFFQSIWASLNPFARLFENGGGFYFGFSLFLLAVFGIFLSMRKSMPGFWTAVVILLCTTSTAGLVFARLPGGPQWMLRFLSIAAAMVLFCFLTWDTLKKGWVVLFCVLLAADALPSLPVVGGNRAKSAPEERLAGYADRTLLGEAKAATRQRLAFIDGHELNAVGAWLLAAEGEPVATSYGAARQTCSTADNYEQLNRALAEGSFLYLFDRCLELGNDTVVVCSGAVRDPEDYLEERMDSAAERSGYRLVDRNDSYRFYKLDAEGSWGTVTEYRGIAIGSDTAEIARDFPCMEETLSRNLNDYTYEELSGYELVYLSGFTFDDKAAAEEMILRLSESGVRIVIAADGIPEERNGGTRGFLGATCSSVSFSQGYPDLVTENGILDTDLFPDGYREWNTVYVNGLDEVWGTVNDLEWNLPFYGTVKNDNIVVIGLNLTYYYGLTGDEGVGKLLELAMDISPGELPRRELVPFTVSYEPDAVTISCGRDNVNTGIAFHDSFVSNQEIRERNHLTYVGDNVTVISFARPYLTQGIAVSGSSALLLGVFALYVRRRTGHGKENGVSE